MIDLEIADITVGEGTLSGNGAFDVFMRAAMVHLRREYAEGRINGDKYADAYIAIMNNVLNTASQFAVNKVNIANQREISEEQRRLYAAQAEKTLAEIPLVEAQISKVNADIELINANLCVVNQKCLTEKAQTMDTVPDLGTPGNVVQGSIGKQKEVYDAQIKGFTSDALQKATKLIVDTWSVRESATDSGTGATTENKLVDPNVGKMVAALGQNVGVSL